jgi:hypothetical protein
MGAGGHLLTRARGLQRDARGVKSIEKDLIAVTGSEQEEK